MIFRRIRTISLQFAYLLFSFDNSEGVRILTRRRWKKVTFGLGRLFWVVAYRFEFGVIDGIIISCGSKRAPIPFSFATFNWIFAYSARTMNLSLAEYSAPTKTKPNWKRTKEIIWRGKLDERRREKMMSFSLVSAFRFVDRQPLSVRT